MKKLKKVVIRVAADLWYKELFDLVEKFEIFQILRYDESTIYVTYKMKFIDPKATPEVLDKKSLGIYHTEVIAEDKTKNEYIFFSKHHWLDKKIKDIFNNIDIMLEPPIFLEDGYLTIPFLLEHKDLDEFLSIKEKIAGDLAEIVSITSINPNFDNLYLTLTDRQKEIIFYAVQQGYYDIPRRISSKELAQKFDISKSALCEHVRKIEKVIFSSIFK